MAALIPERAIGLLFEKEIKILDELKDAPAHPYYAILGGSKVSDKIKVIHNLLKRVDGILIGGAMGHAFWKAKGIDIPKDAKQPSAEDVKAALSVIELAELKKTPLLYPKDTVKGFDIGEETIKEFCAFVENAKTIFWNGPLGWFEKPEYEVGTRRVAEYLADLDAKTVLGGGDTVSAINHFGLGSKFYHLSTGGGATLKYLEGEALPALNALRP